MSSIFSKIIQREIPAHILLENADFISFLDVNPNSLGHTLIVPKKEVDKLFDLDMETYVNLFSFARTVAHAMEKAIICNRIGMSVIGLEVPHVHIHLIPLHNMDDATFQKKIKTNESEMNDILRKIQKFL